MRKAPTLKKLHPSASEASFHVHPRTMSWNMHHIPLPWWNSANEWEWYMRAPDIYIYIFHADSARAPTSFAADNTCECRIHFPKCLPYTYAIRSAWGWRASVTWIKYQANSQLEFGSNTARWNMFAYGKSMIQVKDQANKLAGCCKFWHIVKVKGETETRPACVIDGILTTYAWHIKEMLIWTHQQRRQ